MLVNTGTIKKHCCYRDALQHIMIPLKFPSYYGEKYHTIAPACSATHSQVRSLSLIYS